MRLSAIGRVGLKITTPEEISAQVQTLVKKLEDKNSDIREKAIRALGMMAENAKEAVPVLTEILLKDKDWYIRAISAWALGYIGGETVLPGLTEAGLKDKNEFVRWGAIEAIGRSGRTLQDIEVINTVLVKALSSDENMYVWREAKNGLIQLNKTKQHLHNIR